MAPQSCPAGDGYMERVNTGRSVLEVTVEGDGEPVLLLHGSIMGETYRAMMREPALAGRYKLISVLRQGFAGSSHSEGPYSIGEQAADALAVLHAMGEERAHVVGHSYGGVIALQLAFDAPGSVHSLALLEPALLMVPAAGAFSEAMVPANEAYTSGDPRAAIDAFMRAACGDNYLEVSDATVGPGWFDQAVADAATLFAVELPAIQEWTAPLDIAGRITQPILSVLGEQSGPLFIEGADLLKEWFPQTERFVLTRANHMLQYMNPGDMAQALAAFFARYPMMVSARETAAV